MLSVKWYFDTVSALVQKWLGVVEIHEVDMQPSLVEHLTGYAFCGYEVRLFCQKRVYRRTYRRWPFLISKTSVFRVYTVVSPNAPEKLKELCELDICLPGLLPRLLSENVQKEIAIQIYLDVLTRRMMNKPRQTA